MIYRKYIKVVMDFIASLFLLIVLSPIILIITLVLLFVNNGKPFFFQARPGKHEQIFRIIKFKTMNDAHDEDGNLLPDSKRMTNIGNFLRKSSLDELPQLFNVLLGQMSFVGPRPLIIEYLPYYKEEERLRHTVRPGITGLAQVSGRNFLLWDDRLAKDVEYVRKQSFLLDLKILINTVFNVLVQKDLAVDTSSYGFQQNLDIERSNQK